MQNDTQSNLVETKESPDGERIGQSATSKISFHGATPVAQQAAAGNVTGFTAGSSTAALVDSTHTGNVGSSAYTVSDIVFALKTLGLMAE